MEDLNDDQFDAMFRRHLSKELDGQLGRAEETIANLNRRRSLMRIAAWAGVAMAAAAAVAIVLLRPGPAAQAPAAVATAIEYQLDSQTIDQGTVFLDQETPVRQYVQRQVETARWTNPVTNERIEWSVPQDQVVLVGLNSH